MNPPHETAGESQRIASFQLHGNAAERYERWVVPFVAHPMVSPLLDLADVRPGERVLDLATGTGLVARLAARRVTPGGAVTGLDLNEDMLTVAQELPLPPGLQIEWRQGSALALPFDDGVFDVVVCQQGFQFFPDRMAALQEMRRVLRASGRVALSVFTGGSPYFMALRDAVERHVSAQAAGSTAAGWSLGDANEFGALLSRAGFHDVVVHHVQLTLRLPAMDEFVLGHLSLGLDSAPTHTAKVVTRWLVAHPQVQVLWWPKYAAHEVNPAERIWGLMKDDVAANRLAGSIEYLVRAARRFFQELSPHPVTLPQAA